jgi:hypothetical protein
MAWSLVTSTFHIRFGHEAMPEHSGVPAEIISAETKLDGNFPNTDNAENQLVVRVFEQNVGCGRQALWRYGCPQKHTGIEQKSQALGAP